MADAPALGAGGRKAVWVRPPPCPPPRAVIRRIAALALPPLAHAPSSALAARALRRLALHPAGGARVRVLRRPVVPSGPRPLPTGGGSRRWSCRRRSRQSPPRR